MAKGKTWENPSNLAKQASEESKAASKYAPTQRQYGERLGVSAVLYEKAGDNSVLKARYGAIKYRDRKNLLLDASHYYQLGTAIASPEDKERIKGKMVSVNNVINPSQKSSQRRLMTEGNNPKDLGGAVQKLSDAIEKSKRTQREWERTFAPAIISIITLFGALVFSAFNLTGYAVSGITSDNFRIIGMCLFICGLVFAFIYLKGRNKF